jgi:hypothetical protein
MWQKSVPATSVWVEGLSNMEGAKTWIFPDGYLPAKGQGEDYIGHDCICIVNTSLEAAQCFLDFYFEDTEPQLNIPVLVGAQRSLHLRLDKPEQLGGYALPREKPYSARLRSSVPVVAQYSRLDVKQSNMAFLSNLGYPVP